MPAEDSVSTEEQPTGPINSDTNGRVSFLFSNNYRDLPFLYCCLLALLFLITRVCPRGCCIKVLLTLLNILRIRFIRKCQRRIKSRTMNNAETLSNQGFYSKSKTRARMSKNGKFCE